MRIGYNAAALTDARKIAIRYRNQAGLEIAAAFASEVDACLDTILERPASFAVRLRDIRAANLHRFPCQILFRLINDDHVRILAVRHHRQRPSYGMRRR
jgi:Plasmid stabilization system protein